MISAAIILTVAAMGLRWPGLFVAAVFFGFPAGVFSGMSWITTAITLLGIATMLAGYLTRRQRLTFSAMDFTFVLFVGLTLLSATWSPANPVMPHVTSFTITIVALYLLIRLVFSFQDPDRRLTELMVGLMGLGLVFGMNVILSADRTAARFSLEGKENIAVGLTQALETACIVACAYALSARGPVRLLSLPVIAATGYALVVTGTRGALLTVVAGVAFYLVRAWGLGRLSAAVFLGTPVVLLLATLFVDPARLMGLSDIRVFNFASYGSTEDASSAIRLYGYLQAWDVFVDQPFFGAGLGGFYALTSIGYPHNIELELLTNTGLVGLALVLVLIGLTVSAMMDPQFCTLPRLCFLALIFAAFCHHQISFSLPSGKALFLFLALPALLQGFRRKTQQQPTYSLGSEGGQGALAGQMR